MTPRAEWEAGVSLFVNDENGEPMEYVARSVYDRIVGLLQEKLQEQNRILGANVSVETWERWKALA